VIDERPVALEHRVGDVREMLEHADVERRRAANAVMVEHGQETPETDAVAVLVHRILLRVGQRGSGPRIANAIQRRQILVVLDVRRHPECDARTVRPSYERPVDDRRIVDAIRCERRS
jgi:hypothetical protein